MKTANVCYNFSAVFVCDTGKMCFIWEGKEASIDERRKSFQYAHVSSNLPVVLFLHSHENFESFFTIRQEMIPAARDCEKFISTGIKT